MIDQQNKQAGLSWWPIYIYRNHVDRDYNPKKHHE